MTKFYIQSSNPKIKMRKKIETIKYNTNSGLQLIAYSF